MEYLSVGSRSKHIGRREEGIYLTIVRNIPYRCEEYTFLSQGIYLLLERYILFSRRVYTIQSKGIYYLLQGYILFDQRAYTFSFHLNKAEDERSGSHHKPPRRFTPPVADNIVLKRGEKSIFVREQAKDFTLDDATSYH